MATEPKPAFATLPADPVVLVTGASTGIGLALAHNLIARRRVRVVITARSSSLHRFASEGLIESDCLWIRPLDVTRADQRKELTDEINKRLGGVVVLIKNAGVAYRSVTEHIDSE